jgi:hypothetical protein
MKLLITGLLAFTSMAFAADIAPVSYHDGTVVSFPAQASDNCFGGSRQSCGDDYQGQYTVKSEGVFYILTPANTADGNFAERAALGWSKTLTKSSSLYHQPAGTPILLRDDGRHIFVKVGNRESKYTVLEER